MKTTYTVHLIAPGKPQTFEADSHELDKREDYVFKLNGKIERQIPRHVVLQIVIKRT